jgi:hypothetical protein
MGYVSGIRGVWAVVAAILLCVIGASTAAAQFGLPKINVPKLPGQKQTKPKPQGEQAAPPPAITAIDPDSGPPGGAGELVLTGKNLDRKLEMEFLCRDSQISSSHFKVQSAERATVSVSIPLNAKEGPCAIRLTRYWKVEVGKDGEDSPSGTPEVMAVPDNWPKFTVSNAGKLPVVLPDMALLGEGEMNYMDIMIKSAQDAQAGSGRNPLKGGQFVLTDNSFKYVQEGKEIFSVTPATTKSVDEMTQMGQSMGIFRIVLTNGKVYNFRSLGTGHAEMSAEDAIKFIKKKLGK